MKKKLQKTICFRKLYNRTFHNLLWFYLAKSVQFNTKLGYRYYIKIVQSRKWHYKKFMTPKIKNSSNVKKSTGFNYTLTGSGKQRYIFNFEIFELI